MSMKRFLDASYVLLVEMFKDIRPNMPLEELLEMADGYQAGAKDPPKSPDEVVTASGNPSEGETESERLRREEMQMAEFDNMLRGTVSRG